MGVNSVPKTVTRQRRGRDLNLGPSAPESSTLPSHPEKGAGGEVCNASAPLPRYCIYCIHRVTVT